jgi:enoyl-CoA hydratase/carnithine racemase
MLQGSGRIGFSELAVGLPLPLNYIHGIHRIVQPSAVRLLIEGAAYKPEEALSIGLIDGVAEDAEKLRALVLKRFDAILRMEKEAFLPTRPFKPECKSPRGCTPSGFAGPTGKPVRPPG